ncbi:MAG: OmpH family outer membrane protein [Prevotella sp.]|nr:OmpH family outer membrane protein [Prevotella sp.]
MKRFFLPLMLTLVFALGANAQGLHFGFISYDQALTSMPDYALVQTRLATLRAQYEAETRRVEDEFNAKYEQFLDGQRDFPPTILQKRQSELQELMEKNIAFKEESRRLLAEAEQEAMAPLHQKLSNALQSVGFLRGVAFIINTDQNACPFINPEMGIDVTQDVLEAVRH